MVDRRHTAAALTVRGGGSELGCGSALDVGGSTSATIRGQTASVFWEFGEFTLDSCLGTHIQIDLDDTMSDMAFGILGGVLFLLRRGSRQGPVRSP